MGCTQQNVTVFSHCCSNKSDILFRRGWKVKWDQFLAGPGVFYLFVLCQEWELIMSPCCWPLSFWENALLKGTFLIFCRGTASLVLLLILVQLLLKCISFSLYTYVFIVMTLSLPYKLTWKFNFIPLLPQFMLVIAVSCQLA